MSKVLIIQTKVQVDNLQDIIEMASNQTSELYEKGKEVRIKVLGEAYVKKKLASRQSEFTQPLQQFSTEVAWGSVWARPGLALRDRSLASMCKNLPNCPAEPW